MNFLDLRDASDEERRLITEILSNSPPANIEFPFDLKSACKIDNDQLNRAIRSMGNDKNFDCDAKNVNNIDTNYGDSLTKVGSPNIAAQVGPVPTAEQKPSTVHVNKIQPMAPVSTSPHMVTHHPNVSGPNANNIADSSLLNQSQIAASFPHGAIKTNYNVQPPLVQQGLSNTSGPPQVPMQMVVQNSSSNQNQHHRSIHNSQHSHAAHPQPQPRIPYQSRKHYNNNIHPSNSSTNNSNLHHHYQNHFQSNTISSSTNTISPNSQNSSDTCIRLRNVNSNDSASSNTATPLEQTLPPGYNGNLQQPLQHMQNAKMSSKSDQKSMYNQDGSSVQLSSMSGDINSVMMDMASGQSYAMAASHVPTFGPQIAYGPHPIYPYFFSLPHFPVQTYMIPTNSVVPPQGQVPPQQSSTNQPPTSGMPQSRQHQPPQFHGSNHHHHRRQSPNGDNTPAQSSTMSSDSPRIMDKSANSNQESTESSGLSEVSNIDEQNVSIIVEGSTHINSNVDHSPSQENNSPEKRSAKMDNANIKETYQENNLPNNNETKILVNGYTQYTSQTRASYKSRLSGNHSRKTPQENHQQPTELKAEDNSTERSTNANINGRLSKQQSAKQTRFSNESQQRSNNSWANKRSLPVDHVQTNSTDNISVKIDDVTKTVNEETLDNQSIPESQEVPKRSSSATRDSQNSNHEQTSHLPPTAIQESSDNDKESQEGDEHGSTSVRSSNSKSLWTDLFKTKNADGSTSFAAENDRSLSSRDRSKDGTINNNNTSSNVSNNNLATSRTKRHRLSGRYASHESASQAESRQNLDEFAPKLAKKIQEITLKHSLPFLRSRGFINRGNGCYINATLQALVACPPFYNLMHELGEIKGLKRPNSCTPIIDSFAEFFLNFLPPEISNRKNRTSSNQDQRMPMDELQAEPIEPRCIYNVLGEIKSECLKGAQEDAEEFLSSVLNGLHEEMVDLSEIAQSNLHGGQSDNHSNQTDSSDDTNDDVNLWREVGPRNRSLPIRSAKVINTPIQDIFGGSLFSLRTAGKDRCGHRQPFFALQLDISSDNVKSVQDAIKSFTTPETIHDFYCSKTKQKLDASCRTSLDQLPPILILHLKQFVYTQDQGLRKLVKKIDYPIDFLLPDNCLHDKQNYFDRNHTSKSYKLLAVVYHDGNEAIKGHYLTDVYHIGSSQWIRCDDSTLKVISTQQLLSPDPPRTPYLLFYRRLNTLRIQQSSKK